MVADSSHLFASIEYIHMYVIQLFMDIFYKCDRIGEKEALRANPELWF